MKDNNDPIVSIPSSRDERAAVVRQAAQGDSVWSGSRFWTAHMLKRENREAKRARQRAHYAKKRGGRDADNHQ